MSALLERLANEIQHLSPREAAELHAWWSRHRPVPPGAVNPPIAAASSWPDFAARAREVFPDGPPSPGPTVAETLAGERAARF